MSKDNKTAEQRVKRRDECVLCTSCSCYDRVLSLDPGFYYDEVACDKHAAEARKLSDVRARGVLRRFTSSTGKIKRGEPA